MGITLRRLRCFVEIARSRSVSRAAAHLRVARPALSQHIGPLEEELGARPFDRHPRGVDLSPAGVGIDALRKRGTDAKHGPPARFDSRSQGRWPAC